MDAPVSLDDLDARRRDLEALVDTARDEADADRLSAIAAAVSGRAAELESLARRHVEGEQALTPRAGMIGRIEIVLTPEQRARILERTGVDLPSFIAPDELGVMARTMPRMDPRLVEALATNEAERKKVALAAGAVLREETERTFRALEETGVPDLIDRVARMRRDLETPPT